MHRLIAPLVFSSVLIIGAGTCLFLYNGAQRANQTQAEEFADEAVDRVMQRLDQHLSLLRATKAFFIAHDSVVERIQFRHFIDALEITKHYPGVQGIGFAKWEKTGDETPSLAALQQDYGPDIRIWPDTDQSMRTPIMLLEPQDARNHAALGYDMFSEPVRRAAITKAMSSDQIAATGPVMLVQEITTNKQAGFLVYTALVGQVDSSEISHAETLQGFVYAPFRAGDLFRAAFAQSPSLPVLVKAYDSGNDAVTLYKDNMYETQLQRSGTVLPDTVITRKVDVADRQWIFDIIVLPKQHWNLQDLAPFIAAVAFFLLACMLAWITHSQLRALRAAHNLRALSEKSLTEKDLLLQEMKHRIKNSIARILAMARQSAHHAEDIDSFSLAFTARLQAMANAQDALTRSHWQSANLKDLLTKELRQVLGDESCDDRIMGPDVELDESTTQALGLTFHELSTNALKYSNVSEDPDVLFVTWSLVKVGRTEYLHIKWVEVSRDSLRAPEHKGFGSKLIDANIRGELNGKIERHFGKDGLTVDIIVPVPSRPKQTMR
ncbi:CHASE domain-containing protein [uncultured Cohaesibacter sp.]|uniref:CHASE domain-containing protein n=1 Tax=uncultured Cohaesibacter sp. TaxID=1002546 RepID=UPI0029C7055A|nr:CHASE domain-containing protein [uncultured Cohaesibacter sp.]